MPKFRLLCGGKEFGIKSNDKKMVFTFENELPMHIHGSYLFGNGGDLWHYDNAPASYDIRFISYNGNNNMTKEYQGFCFAKNAYDTLCFMYKVSDTEYKTVAVYNEEHGGFEWVHDDYRQVELIGSQFVTEEFYEWFTTAAMRDIKGYWLWDFVNGEVPQDPYGYISEKLYVKFRSLLVSGNGGDPFRPFDRLYVNIDPNNSNAEYTYNLLYNGYRDNSYDTGNSPRWTNEELRLIQITDTIEDIENISISGDKELGDEFYEFLKNNARRFIKFYIDNVSQFVYEDATWAWFDGDINTSPDGGYWENKSDSEFLTGLLLNVTCDYENQKVILHKDGRDYYIYKQNGKAVKPGDGIMSEYNYTLVRKVD